MSNLPCDVSKQSAMRFIRLCLSLNNTKYWFHQTLTFGEQVEDFKEAKKCLHSFLDSFAKEMQKDLEMGVLYIMGRQQNRKVHFHLIFFCYPPQPFTPENLAVRLRRTAWQRWERHARGAIQKANRLTIRSQDRALRYLLKEHFSIADTKREPDKPKWYDSWNIGDKDFIKNHSTPIEGQSVRQKFGELFGRKGRIVVSREQAQLFKEMQIELNDRNAFDGETL